MKAAIIANPASGKDIRRIVAHGSVFDNQEKVRMVRRILVGLAAAGVRDVLYMPEGYGIVPRALSDLEALETPVNVAPVDIYQHNTQEDTVNSAALMQQEGVAVIIVMGGDGTWTVSFEISLWWMWRCTTTFFSAPAPYGTSPESARLLFPAVGQTASASPL